MTSSLACPALGESPSTSVLVSEDVCTTTVFTLDAKLNDPMFSPSEAISGYQTVSASFANTTPSSGCSGTLNSDAALKV